MSSASPHVDLAAAPATVHLHVPADFHSYGSTTAAPAAAPANASAPHSQSNIAHVAHPHEEAQTLRARPTAASATSESACSSASPSFNAPAGSHVVDGEDDPEAAHDPEAPRERDPHNPDDAPVSLPFPILSRPRAPTPVHQGGSAWRIKAHTFLESKRVHMFILALVIIDLCLVLSEVFIELFEFQKCRQHTGPEKFEEPHSIEEAGDSLRYASIAILSVFVLETLAKVIVFGFRYFLKHPFHLFDAAVIITSWIVTILLHGPLEEIVSLFIFLRLWRVARIIDGVVVSVHAEHEFKHEKHKKQLRALKEELAKYKAMAGEGGTAGGAGGSATKRLGGEAVNGSYASGGEGVDLEKGLSAQDPPHLSKEHVQAHAGEMQRPTPVKPHDV